MLCWAFKANFTNRTRRTTQAISFHDMAVKKPGNEMKSVTHVYTQSVTHVCAPCREGERTTGRASAHAQGRGEGLSIKLALLLFICAQILSASAVENPPLKL